MEVIFSIFTDNFSLFYYVLRGILLIMEDNSFGLFSLELELSFSASMESVRSSIFRLFVKSNDYL